MDQRSKTRKRLALELFAASFVVLFQELTLIRWLPAQIRVLAYFPNLILLSAFLGLGLGCLRAGRRPLLWAWLPALVALATAALALSQIVFTQDSAAEHLYLLYYDLPRAPVVHDVRLPIIVFFILSVGSFVALGQAVAERLEEFRRRSIALTGYCWDILGSLAGVVAFAALCFARAFPVAWFAVFLAAGFVLFADRHRTRLGYLAAAALVLVIVRHAERSEQYSPYYALRLVGVPDQPAALQVLANGSVHQYVLPLNRNDQANEVVSLVREGYHLPYRLLSPAPRRALVVGAGTGNDVAVLLDEGAERIDAVEIDPVIIEYGRKYHPDRPYESARVHVFNTDARSFLNHTEGQYDLIVFGTLDSVTRLSALSNVRLDNFVYTLECIARARERLAPGGGIVMYFMVTTEYIDLRLRGMLAEVFGEDPLVEARRYGPFNRIYMAGAGFERHGGEARRAAVSVGRERVWSRIELPRDDWPFLYLRRRGINGFYATLMATFGALAVLGVAAASEDVRRSLRSGTALDGEMFFFGLAFLLLETRSVTEMTLVWGATWLTSAVVFGSILAMILLASLVAQSRPLSYGTSMVGLVFSLLVAYAVPTRLLLVRDPAMRLTLSAVFVGVPIFFAASCFALLFRSRPHAAAAFGWNLLGAVVGGLLEFVSMAVGLKSLLLVAMGAYLGATLIHLRSRPLDSSGPPGSALPRDVPPEVAPSVADK